VRSATPTPPTSWPLTGALALAVLGPLALAIVALAAASRVPSPIGTLVGAALVALVGLWFGSFLRDRTPPGAKRLLVAFALVVSTIFSTFTVLMGTLAP
jgi:putative Ca2+/H+ antiporter (TMEM165/GDT1 family)